MPVCLTHTDACLTHMAGCNKHMAGCLAKSAGYPTCTQLDTWAARHYSRLLIELTPKGVVFSFPAGHLTHASHTRPDSPHTQLDALHTRPDASHTRPDAPPQVRGLPEVRLEEHDGVHSAPVQAQHAA